jgi:2-polyprenyl-3-methyl-5-hydroxy-6-metoxy-1,4-benzoquinol methylase
VQLADLQSALAAVPARQGRLAVLLGGEPFLRPDFLRLLAAVRAAGCGPGVVTTGRPLVYPRLRERLRRAGLAYLRVQLFGVGEAHDRATGVPGSFDQALAGLRAWLAEAGGDCDVDVALSTRQRPSEALATEIEALAREIPSPAVQIVVALDPADSSEAHGMESWRPAAAALAGWNEDDHRPLLAWEGLPEPPGRPSYMTIRPLRPAFVAAAPRACCLGTVNDIVRARAAGRERTRANSFNFVRTDLSVPWAADANQCTAHAAPGGGDPCRSLWLIEDERLILYATDTGDFTAAEITRIKDELSHLFVDRAPAGVLDDFTEGMRRTLPDAVCGSCPHRGRCGRRSQIAEGPPFAREEEWIATHIAGLRGRVLDVGCGEQLYQKELAPLVRSGAVQYTGLDPDELSLSRLRAALPEARLQVGTIEDFRGTPASYDHILCLRSLNHVIDVDEALARMAGLLKPGGSLLLVECTPFAMLRQPAQVAAADRAPRAGHQHLRNMASDEVLPFARRHSLQVLHHHPASRQTTNEWIVLLARAQASAAGRARP